MTALHSRLFVPPLSRYGSRVLISASHDFELTLEYLTSYLRKSDTDHRKERWPQTKPNKKQQLQEEGERSGTCAKDLTLLVPQRLVLEGKRQHVGKYSLREVPASPLRSSAFPIATVCR